MKGYVWIPCLLLMMAMAGCSGTRKNGRDTNTTKDTIADVLEILNQKLKEDPNNAGLLYERSRYYYEHKLLDKGLEDITKALSIDSSQSDYYLVQADFFYATNKISEAKAAILKAIDRNPKNKEANVKMGELNYYLGDYATAFKYLDDALRIDPYQAKVYFIKGMCFKENGDTNLALSSFRTAVEQDPDYFNAYMQLANIYAARNDDMAIDYYNNAILVNPAMVEAHYGLGYYLQEHGKPDGAIKVYNDLLSIDPNNAPALHNIGYTFLFHKDDPQSAIPWFTKAVTADPEIVNGYYHRGYAYELLKDYVNARKDYEKSLRLDPDFALAKERLNKIKGK